jgi:SAM-dependent methyltransferase
MDASNLPFDDSSLKSVFMLNTLHHIPDSTSLFNEIERCLKPDGRMLIIDQYNGWFSKIIYRHLHHEPYDPNATSWCFQPSGPLSGANGALCWIIFYRDRALFEQLYPTLKIINISPNTPLRYWLSGGLKPWQLIPGTLFEISTKLDNWLSKKLPEMSSFVEVELVKSAY